METLFCYETILSLRQKRIHKIFNKDTVSETKTFLKRAHAQRFFKNIFIASFASPSFVYHWMLAWKSKFYYKSTLRKVFWKIIWLETICSVKYILVLFISQTNWVQILETCSWRSLFLEKIGFTTPLLVEFN